MALIDQLPLELSRDIAGRITDRQDFYALTQSRPGLETGLLGNELFNQQQLKRLAPRSLEYLLAEAEKITWRAALVNVLEREYNLTAGRPVNIASFPIQEDFLYQDHTLLILRDKALEVYNIHSNEVKIFPNVYYGLPEDAQNSEPKLIHYCSETLSIRLEGFGSPNECRLGIFRVTDEENLQLLLLVNVPQGGSEVVRNDKYNAVVGTHTRTNEGWSWRFAWFSLESQSATRLYEIGNFNSHDVGTNIVFEVLDNCFWAITSEVTVDPEGEDPVSYYGGCRVNLSIPGSRAQYFRMWRRKQTEGPIHDSFTRLALMKDEKDDRTYMVTESRAEWLKPEKAERSFYTTFFKPSRLEPEPPDLTRPLAYEDLARETHQDNFDCIESLLAAGDEPFLTVFTGKRHRHMEQGRDFKGNDSAAGTSTYRARQLAHSAFFPLSNVWLDVVWDASSKFGDQALSLKGEHILRLRVGSRRVGPDYNNLSAEDQDNIDISELALKTPKKPTDLPRLETRCPVYSHQPIVLYPGKDAPIEELRRLQIPGYPSAEKFKIFSDDRSIIIGLKDLSDEEGFAYKRNVIVINFDPLAKWDEVRSQLDKTELSQGEAIGPPQAHNALLTAKDAKLTERTETPADSEGSLAVKTSLRLVPPRQDEDEASSPHSPLQNESSGEDEKQDEQESSLEDEITARGDTGKGRRASTLSNPSDSNPGEAAPDDSSNAAMVILPSTRARSTAAVSELPGPSRAGPSKTQKKRRPSNSSESTVYSKSGPFSFFYEDHPRSYAESSDDEQVVVPAGKRPRLEASPEPGPSAAQVAEAARFEEGLRQRNEAAKGDKGSDCEYPSSASEDRHHAEELFPEYTDNRGTSPRRK